MRYLREHSPELPIYEIDEEVMKENGDEWPKDNKYKDKVLIPKIASRIIELDEAIFFASYIPDEILKEAKTKGFKIIILDLSLEELKRRNKQRMEEEAYDDSSSWLELQKNTNLRLMEEGIADLVIDGHKSVERIAEELLKKYLQ
jgi:hypothetical protein